MPRPLGRLGGPPVLEGVEFGVHAGQRIGVLGPNGGGKSTLFRVITGELRPSNGAVWRETRCAVLPQTERSRLDYPVSALDVVLMGAIVEVPGGAGRGAASGARGARRSGWSGSRPPPTARSGTSREASASAC